MVGYGGMKWEVVGSHDLEAAALKKTRGDIVDDISSLLGGGYLRLPASPTVVVVTLRALCQDMG